MIDQVLDFYGNPTAMQKAIEAATPNLDKLKEIEERQDRLKELLLQVDTGKKTIARMIVKGTMTEDIAEKALADADAKEVKYREEFARNEQTLENLPTPERIKAASERVASHLVRDRRASAVLRADQQRLRHAKLMTWQEKRDLIEDVFNGTTLDGKKTGVYVDVVAGQTNHRHKRWRFRLHGNAAVEGIYGRTRDEQCVADSASR